MKNLLAFIYFLAAACAHGEGFLAGTLVKTPNGYTPIEKLQEKDLVICYDFQGNCVTRRITKTFKQSTSDYIRLWINDELIEVASDHKFFLPLENRWIEAKCANSKHVFLSRCIDLVLITAAQYLTKQAEVYDITVEEFHNFCVSNQDVHVHNISPVVAIGISWAFEGPIVWTASIGLAGLGWGIGYLLSSNRHARPQTHFNADEFGQRFNNKKHHEESYHTTAASGGSSDDFDDEDPYKEEQHKSKQMKKLSEGEIKKLEAAGIDVHTLKPNSKFDLFKNQAGEIFVKPKAGNGPGDSTGFNINNF